MTKEQMKRLQPGDIIRGKVSGEAFIVTANYGERVTAVKTVDIKCSSEWDVIRGYEAGSGKIITGGY
jgi:hypothetical protein